MGISVESVVTFPKRPFKNNNMFYSVKEYEVLVIVGFIISVHAKFGTLHMSYKSTIDIYSKISRD